MMASQRDLQKNDLSKKAFVSGLNLDVTEDNLKSFMARFGTVKSVFIVKNKLTGKSKGKDFILDVQIQFRNGFCGVRQ